MKHVMGEGGRRAVTAALAFVSITFVVMSMVMFTSGVRAEPVTPTHDDEVVEVLPGSVTDRAAQRRQRESLAARPKDPALALSVTTALLAQARELGDPRFVGQALSALEPWTDDRTMPLSLLLMKATLEQYLHEFDSSAAMLQEVLARNPLDPQAWITLATVRRVQGRYAESDKACDQLLKLRAHVHGNACLAENQALRGQWDTARTTLTGLIAETTNPTVRAWLFTTLAELEQRAGNPQASEAAFKQVLALTPDPYATLDYADLLIEQHRPAQALQVLKNEVRADPVVLRLAIAGTMAKASSAAADVADMRDRIALANLRPEAQVYHGREQAMFELQIEGRQRQAFELAKLNATNQREPLDILVLAETAKALGDPAAIAEAKRVQDEMGLHDRRIDALR